jgi:RimK family alpha-L-glutamate ligase
MKVLLIGNTKSFESRRIQEEFKNAGHEITALSVKDIIIRVENNDPVFTTYDSKDLMAYDLYLFRGMGDAMWEMMVFAKHLHTAGKIIIEEKLATQRALMTKLPYTMAKNGIPTIDSKLIFEYREELDKELEFPLIMKGTQSSRGRAVFKIHNIEEFKEIYNEIGPKVLLQKYIPITFDYRVFIVGEKILGVMKRFNSEDNFLTNISAGGTAEPSTLPQEVLEMCKKAKALRNTEISGVDVIEHGGKYYVLEVNTSPQFQGFETATGVNVGKEIVEYGEHKFQAPSSKFQGKPKSEF